MLKRLTRTLMMMGLVGAMIIAPAADAGAQIDTGGYNIRWLKDASGCVGCEGDGGSTQIGHIRVPTRSVNSPKYIEEWAFLENHLSTAFAPDSIIEIVPIRAADAPHSMDAEILGPAVTRLELSADEHDIERGDPGVDHTSSIHLSEAPSCHVKEIWQCASCGADPERRGMVPVGAIRQTMSANGVVAEQEWLLSAGYVYPSPSNGIITQLRPSSRSCSQLALDGLTIVRTIHVQVSSAETLHRSSDARDGCPPLGADPALGCALGPRRGAGTPAWPPALVFHFVAALLLIRRRARDQQR